MFKKAHVPEGGHHAKRLGTWLEKLMGVENVMTKPAAALWKAESMSKVVRFSPAYATPLKLWRVGHVAKEDMLQRVTSKIREEPRP